MSEHMLLATDESSQTASNELLALRQFGVAFAERTILTEITLDLPSVGLTCLVGPSGSGKSTLLRTIAGLNDSHPALSTWGEATLQGQLLRLVHIEAPGNLRKGVGFVTQHARFFVDSVRENLVSNLPNRNVLDRPSQSAIVTALLEQNGLGELVPRLQDDVASLSKSLQRRLAIVRSLVAEPKLLFADEPTADLSETDAASVMQLLVAQSKVRSVFLVTHNQRHARLADRVVLIAGGRVQEISPAGQFFDAPSTEAGRTFVKTGGCPHPNPNATQDELAPGWTPVGSSVRREEKQTDTPTRFERNAPKSSQPLGVAPTRSRFDGPRGFFWVKPDQLGGLPRPGIVDSLQHDLEGLQRLGVSTLVTLEETVSVDIEALTAMSIHPIHFPIVDMSVPSHEAAHTLCAQVRDLLQEGAVIAMHCRAGLGRTGTMLACQLIFDGEAAQIAIERIRWINPKCIQSQAQTDFLASFEHYLWRCRGMLHDTPS